jgi:hypothetical protein
MYVRKLVYAQASHPLVITDIVQTIHIFVAMN